MQIRTQVQQFLQAVTPLQNDHPVLRNLKLNLYHDEQLSQQKRASLECPDKLKAWRDIIERVKQDNLFPKQFIPLVELNSLNLEDGKFPEHLYLYGLDSCKISDFNDAFMEYGVQKKQFHQFYRRVTLQEGTYCGLEESKEYMSTCTLPENFISLKCVSELDFVSFAKFWSDFQTSIFGVSMRNPDLKLTEKEFVFFGNRSLD